MIAYKDRLTRFGYEKIENIIEKHSKGKIIIINREEEMTIDLLAIMNMYVAKVNGLRKYKKKIKKEIEGEKEEKGKK